MESPKVRATEFEVFRYGFGFVVENAVFNFVALSGVVNVEGSVVVGELVHDVAEHGKVWNNAGVIFPKRFAIFEVGFTEDKSSVNIGAYNWPDIHTVLQREDVKACPMSSVLI